MEELDIKQMESIIKNKLLSGSEESYKSYEMLVNHLGKDKQSVKIFYDLLIVSFGNGMDLSSNIATRILKGEV